MPGRITYKLAVMVYRCLHGQAPRYTRPTISLQPLTSLPCFVSVLRTDSNFSYFAVDLTRTVVGLSSLLVRRCGIRNMTTRRMVQTVLNSSLRQSCSVFTNVTSALEVSLNDMRYINSRFSTYFTYLHAKDVLCFVRSFRLPKRGGKIIFWRKGTPL